MHPARQIGFNDLLAGLKEARANRLVYERPGPDGLLLYVYTERCVFEDAWTPITMVARGLILDPSAQRPKGNVLPGYLQSYAMGRVLDDAS